MYQSIFKPGLFEGRIDQVLEAATRMLDGLDAQLLFAAGKVVEHLPFAGS